MKRYLPHVIFYIMSVVCLALFITGGALLTAGRKSAHKHVGGHISATQPTCTAAGNTEFWFCETCGKYFSDELLTDEISQADTILAQLPHTEETIQGIPATCTTAGLTDGKRCTVCKTVTVKQTTAPLIPHSEEVIQGTPATCTTAGLTDGKRCTVCKTVTLEQTEIKALGHAPDFVPETQSTCFVHGNPDYWYCTRCKQNSAEENCLTPLSQEDVTYPLGDHTYKQCFNTASHYKKATCGHDLGQIDSCEHNFVDSMCTDCGFHDYGVTYTLNDEGTAYLVTDRQALVYLDDVEIYGEYDGLPVTEIAFNSFYNDSAKRLILPDSITKIEHSAIYSCDHLIEIRIPKNAVVGYGNFSGCNELSSITVDQENPYYTAKGNCLIDNATGELISGCNTSVIPNDGSVLSIGNSAFSRREKLTEIIIPDSVTEIKGFAFLNCTSLASLHLSDNVTYIGQDAFGNCENLTELNLPEGITRIDDGAFSGCKKLTKVHIPANVRSLTGNPFQQCTALENITVDENNRWYRSEYNCIIDRYYNRLAVGCKASVIPDGVSEIGRYAFFYCPITQITIPDSVTKIDSSAFAGCAQLTSLHIPASVTHITETAFSHLTAATEITVDPANAYYCAVNNCLIERSTKTLFVGCKNSVIPSDGSVTQIRSGAFSNTDVESVTIPSGVTEINLWTFLECKSLKEVTLPASITRLNGHSFGDCPALTDIYYDGSKEQWNEIKKDSYWDLLSDNYTIHFNDGTTMKKSET